MSKGKRPEPETDEPPPLEWESDSKGGIGILGIDGGYAARRAAAWQRLIGGTASDADRQLLAELWTG
jgi:hypothetical protein